ncbi:NAD-dependent epimerase/dehydratase family protein [Bacillus mangrovi]|uniref:NAD-dependent epimerase/dehydratase family protein n=1 Tax=Metabacillus mangrovi TaxID=1491830 RepID=A0A7X2S3B7_9BACI|nr:GDP-mannose 4,6-dehydratase [Metabacillus mangrovi]MTH52041.1 NAD-dependent epimerase/dehydratase family protein [Metabacillus mangrovi]
MEKAVVTGGSGFIGSHLAESLAELGIEVHILDLKPAPTGAPGNENVFVHITDICSREAYETVKKIRPSFLFHLAAQADVGLSVKDPLYDEKVNLHGTINMLEACKETGAKMIFASTAAVYGSLSEDVLKETDPADPTSPYGLSKLSAESYMMLYRKLFNVPCTILRYANVYGPRQLPKGDGGVVAVFLKSMADKGFVDVHGDGEQTRDFIFVKDVAAANVAVMHKGDGEIFHISTGRTHSINQLIHEMKRHHSAAVSVNYSAERTGDIRHSCLDNAKALSFLNWKPAYSFERGLAETYHYYKSHSES